MNRTLLLTILLGVGVTGCGDTIESALPSDEAVVAMNRGMAQLEMFEYLPAAAEFEKAVDLAPGWVDAKINLAIAWLNLRGEYHSRAVEMCRRALEEDPGNLHANFVMAVLLHLGQFNQGLQPRAGVSVISSPLPQDAPLIIPPPQPPVQAGQTPSGYGGRLFVKAVPQSRLVEGHRIP